jgi:hypothetical protein
LKRECTARYRQGMAEQPKPRAGEKAKPKRDEPVKIDLDPEVALKGLLKIEPEADQAEKAKPHRR